MVYKTDIAVIGGGMAGFSAAYTAAKLGKKVLLVEKRTSLGGLATGGLVMPFMGIMGDGRKIIEGNLDEILNEYRNNFPDSIEGYRFDPEMMKHTLDIMSVNAGIDLLFDTVVMDVAIKDKLISNLKVFNKSGIRRLEADCFIDATGDADISYKAGVPTEYGRIMDGKTQAYSLRFIVGNIDAEIAWQHLQKIQKNEGFSDLFGEYSKRYDVPIMDAGMQNFKIPGRNDSLAFNAPRLIGVNGVDGKSLSDGYILGRKLIRVYTKILRDNVEGCSEAVVTNVADCMGVRESRRIKGQYVLTKDDVVNGRKFDDGICGSCWWIDIHNPVGKGVSEVIAPKGGYYDVPYRTLVTYEVDNLLVAGRCISADHAALASARIMPTCIATGQAVGTAASMAVTKKASVNEIDIGILRSNLADQGALITGINLE